MAVSVVKQYPLVRRREMIAGSAWTVSPEFGLPSCSRIVLGLNGRTRETVVLTRPLTEVAAQSAEDTVQLVQCMPVEAITEETRQLLASLGLDEGGIAGLACVDVFSEDDLLLLQPIGQGPTRLLPLSPSEFVATIDDTTVTFSFADREERPATSLTIDQGGALLVFER